MTNKQAVNWLINLMADIGKAQFTALWHYEQPLMEIRELLESLPERNMSFDESRQEFMNLVYDELHGDGDNNRANRIIDAADSYAEEYEPYWIPCNKKLPTKSDIYLVSSYDKLVFELYFSTEYGWDGWWNGRIGAWMPLPAPWKGEVTE